MLSGKDKIVERFLTEPESVYNRADQLTDSDKRTLMEIEEFFVGIQLDHRLNAVGYISALGDEGELAWIIDAMSGAEEDARFAMEKIASSPELSPIVQEIIYANRAMEGERHEVPAYLMDMARARSSGATGALPAIIIRMAEDVLHVMKSAMQGFLGLPTASVAVRSASVTMEKTARVELVQSLGTAKDQKIHYEVVRESEHSVTISLSIPEIGDDYGINLRQDGRLVDARMVNGGEAIVVTFDHLTPGRYEIEFKGSIQKTFPVHIEDA